MPRLTPLSKELTTTHTETFEISFHYLLKIGLNGGLTKQEFKILKVATQSKKKIYPILQSLTIPNDKGYFTPGTVLNAIQKNLHDLNRIIKGRSPLKINIDQVQPKRTSKDKLFKDFKDMKETFPSSLRLLNRELKSLKIPGKDRRIINGAKKKQRLYNRLESLTKCNKTGKGTPIKILEAIRKNRLELGAILEGKSHSNIWDILAEKENSKPLPLDTNYKYPTKTSNSIWTVKKK